MLKTEKPIVHVCLYELHDSVLSVMRADILRSLMGITKLIGHDHITDEQLEDVVFIRTVGLKDDTTELFQAECKGKTLTVYCGSYFISRFAAVLDCGLGVKRVCYLPLSVIDPESKRLYTALMTLWDMYYRVKVSGGQGSMKASLVSEKSAYDEPILAIEVDGDTAEVYCSTEGMDEGDVLYHINVSGRNNYIFCSKGDTYSFANIYNLVANGHPDEFDTTPTGEKISELEVVTRALVTSIHCMRKDCMVGII